VTLRLILLIVALLCFGAAAAGVSSKIGLQPLGLAFLTAAMLL
jgi:hypothetical protein